MYFFLIFAPKYRLLVLVRTASFNVSSKNKKNIKQNHLKMNIFIAVKYCCILHGRVCVMKPGCNNTKNGSRLETSDLGSGGIGL